MRRASQESDSARQGDQTPPVKGAGKHYVYLARCANGTFYVGCTKNVEQRIAMHNAGRGGRYTRNNRPLTLIASWSFNSRQEALRTERSLKRLRPKRKLALAQEAGPSLGGCE